MGDIPRGYTGLAPDVTRERNCAPRALSPNQSPKPLIGAAKASDALAKSFMPKRLPAQELQNQRRTTLGTSHRRHGDQLCVLILDTLSSFLNRTLNGFSVSTAECPAWRSRNQSNTELWRDRIMHRRPCLLFSDLGFCPAMILFSSLGFARAANISRHSSAEGNPA